MRSTLLVCALLGALISASATTLAQGEESSVLHLMDSTGQTRTVICRPAAPGEAVASSAIPAVRTAAVPTRQTIGPDERTASARSDLPPSPSVSSSGASPVPARGVDGRLCPPPAMPSTAPSRQWYADPAAIGAAWECYAPRSMAYAPRRANATDPAARSPLPAMPKVGKAAR